MLSFDISHKLLSCSNEFSISMFAIFKSNFFYNFSLLIFFPSWDFVIILSFNPLEMISFDPLNILWNLYKVWSLIIKYWFSAWKVKVKVTQSRLTLCDPMYCSLPGPSVHGNFQVRILKWIMVPFSRGSSQPRNWTQVSCIAGGFFIIWATREAQEYWSG